MENIAALMETHLDNLTKPKGSLGKLEEYCMKMALIQGKVPPQIGKKGVYVFAGDHGVSAEGVSLYPDEVTRQMVLNILAGGAGVNALASGTGWEVTMIDGGVKGFFPEQSGASTPGSCRFINAKIREGTRNILKENAMTGEEFKKSIEWGERLALDAHTQGYDLVAIGDLGIGNTTTAAAMLTAAGFPADIVTDRGTGITAEMLENKKKVVEDAVALRAPEKKGEAILEKLGSFEFAMMAGMVLKLADYSIGCVIDGFPVSAAVYMAFLINPKISNYLFAGHLSKVIGHKPLLDTMGLDPILSLDMRLGEGTGALIGGYIVELATITARKMASFAEAGVSESGTQEENY